MVQCLLRNFCFVSRDAAIRSQNRIQSWQIFPDRSLLRRYFRSFVPYRSMNTIDQCGAHWPTRTYIYLTELIRVSFADVGVLQ